MVFAAKIASDQANPANPFVIEKCKKSETQPRVIWKSAFCAKQAFGRRVKEQQTQLDRKKPKEKKNQQNQQNDGKNKRKID